MTKKKAVKKPAHAVRDLTKDFDRLFNDGVLISLSVGYWSAKRRNTADDFGLKEEKIPAFVIGLGTKRLVPKELSDRWEAVASQARYVLRKHSFTFPVGDVPFIPLGELEQTEVELKALRTEFEKAKAHLFKHYDSIRDKMLKDYPQHRRMLSTLYPPREEAVGQFYFDYSVYTISMPKKLRKAAHDKKKADAEQAVMARYAKQLEADYEKFLRQAVTTLRQKTVRVCEAVTARIKSGEVVTDRSLEDLRRFVDKFQGMNFVGDDEIGQRLTKLKVGLLKDRDADAFKTDEAATAALGKALDEVVDIAATVSDVSAVTGGYRRRIDL